MIAMRTQAIHVNERLYEEVQRRAAEEGFETVDAYTACLLEANLNEPPENLEELLTPEAKVHLERVAAELDAGGKRYSIEEVREHFRKKRSDER